MTKKKTYIALAIILVISFLAGLAVDYFTGSGLFNGDAKVTLLFALGLSMVNFVTLLIFEKIRRFLGLEKNSVKPYVICSAISIFAIIIFFATVAYDDIEKHGLAKFFSEFRIFIYTIPYSCIYLMIFLFDVDERVHIVLFDDYIIQRRVAKKPNQDNTPVTINNLREPEQYFKDDEYKELYQKNFDSIIEQAEKFAKILIFENHYENDTCGDYYISRVDFLDDLESESPLYINLTFISRQTKVYSLYGIVDLSKTTTEKDICTIQCSFSYDKTKEEPFVLEEAFTL